MAEIQHYKEIASSLMQNDAWLKRDIYEHLDNLGGLDWNLPDALSKMTWLVKRVDPAPRNAEIAGVRSFSTVTPRVSIVRPGDSVADKERYNHIENSLKYAFLRASARPQGNDRLFFGSTPVERMLRSAIRYGEVAVQVVHVDAQLAFMGEVSESRKRAIRQYGDIVLNIHSPKNVHARVSSFGTEGVLLKKYETLAEFVAFWGDKAKPLLDGLKDGSNQDGMSVCVYDYTDFDVRAVWADVVGTADAQLPIVSYDQFMSAVDGKQIMLEEHDMPFLPWVVRGGVEPINHALHKTKVWDASNVAETLVYSETITYAAAPRLKKTGPDPDSIVIDYTQPGNHVNVPMNHEVGEMRPPEVNDAHVIMGDRARRDTKASTVPSVVTDLNVPGETAFATFDQQMKTGLSAYTPYKELTERALEEVFCHMLYWPKYLDKPLRAPRGKTARNGEIEFSYGGGEFVIEPDTYDYNLSVSVELSPNKIIDDMQKINAASMMVQNLGYDRNTAREQMGETDPERVERAKAAEAMRDSALAARLMKRQMQAETEAQAEAAGIGQFLPYLQDPQVQQIAMQAIQQAIGAAIQQQQQQQQPQGVPQEQMMAEGGMQMIEGSGFDPAMGGMPPATADPRGNTRETQTGMTRREQ